MCNKEVIRSFFKGAAAGLVGDKVGLVSQVIRSNYPVLRRRTENYATAKLNTKHDFMHPMTQMP